MSDPSQHETSADGTGGEGNLDHALLESIFYSEMMLMDDSSALISNNLLSTLAADGSVKADGAAAVLGSDEAVPLPPQQPPFVNQQQHGLSQSTTAHTIGSTTTGIQQNGALHVSAALSHDAAIAPQIHANDIAQSATGHALPQQQAPEMAVSSYSGGPPPPQGLIPTSIPAQVPANHAPVAGVDRPPSSLSLPPLVAASSPMGKIPAAVAPTTPSSELDGEKRQKLVSQFATLASRLGIKLPEPVVDSLTQAATRGTSGSAEVSLGVASAPTQTPPALPGSARGGTDAISSTSQLESNPIVVEIAKAADAAVEAATSRKRSASGGEVEASGGYSNSAANNSDSGSNTNKQAPYSKRRKKPRLSDCETKLAELQSENSMLKRHLANLSSQSHRLDQERHTQEQRMRTMLEQGAAESELDNEVKHFQELYSDYGRRRHQEIHFHLDQLQRLANPTNFTKLGLWTMGQQSSNSRNPIAGILQKELNISTQQGKKILEQRKRIQEVCSNLKECLGLLANLKGLCMEKTQKFHDRLSKCRQILQPKQVVKLIIWINENTEVLESVCPGWGSESILSKKAPVKRNS
eukprot:CAMPEP_0172454474 /NCGR_PEP_ID=MMETSP1065-20121228/11450_1 /TAXON_ID=265537 /ORGANISM="Amphiprora paludosa, Strain CCMP125" /LENGTH=580 /DNA_ID=CAMNT_0013206811 /DNA_START=202 /DNA_END=1944 /DNA_ORIENTATION=-